MFDTYAEIFAERAGTYHSAMTKWPNARDAEFRAVLQPLDDVPDGLVCDMPSGGRYLESHLRSGLRYLGVEPVEQFISAGPEEPITALRASLASVPLANGSVDYVISLAGLHHEQGLAAIFAEMRRLTRRGGRVIIADVAADTPPARFLNGFVARNNPLGHDGRFLDRNTCNLLEAAGLDIVSDDQVRVPWVFDSLGDAGGFCGQLFGIEGLSQQAIAKALEKEIGFELVDGRLNLSWVLRRIVCDAS